MLTDMQPLQYFWMLVLSYIKRLEVEGRVSLWCLCLTLWGKNVHIEQVVQCIYAFKMEI